MSKPKGEKTLGIDVGGVIIAAGRARGKKRRHWYEDFESRPEVEGAIEAIAVLARRFRGRVQLVSKAGPRSQKRILAWLADHDFYRRTGLKPEQISFCRQVWQKAVICERLRITHFIDNRKEVLGYLLAVPKRYYFHPGPAPLKRSKNPLLRRIIRIRSWRQALIRLRRP